MGFRRGALCFFICPSCLFNDADDTKDNRDVLQRLQWLHLTFGDLLAWPKENRSLLLSAKDNSAKPCTLSLLVLVLSRRVQIKFFIYQRDGHRSVMWIWISQFAYLSWQNVEAFLQNLEFIPKCTKRPRWHFKLSANKIIHLQTLFSSNSTYIYFIIFLLSVWLCVCGTSFCGTVLALLSIKSLYLSQG